MRFDLQDLRLFLRVSESPSLTQGAKKVFMSPAAASTRLKNLEEEVGSRLFYRNSRGVELTPAGHLFLHHARIILRQVDYLESEFAAYGTDVTGHIRIFANTTAATEFLPEILGGFLGKRPGVTIDLQERLSRDIIRGVLYGSTDLGILAGKVNNDELEVIRFSTDRLVLITPKNHPLASRQKVKLIDTADYSHIGLIEGTTLQHFLQEKTDAAGKVIDVRIRVYSFEAMCRLVESGVGLAILPDSAARRHLKTMNLSIIELDEPWKTRERNILVRDLDALPKVARSLIDKLIAYGDNLENSK